MIFFNHIYSSLLRRSTVLQSALIFVFYAGWDILLLTIIINIIVIILLPVSFLHQREMGNFHSSFSRSKSHKDSRTRLSILADPKNAIVWMVSVLLPISNRFSLSPVLWEPFQAHKLQLVTPSPACSIVFCFFFVFFLWQCSAGIAKSTRRRLRFFFFLFFFFSFFP